MDGSNTLAQSLKKCSATLRIEKRSFSLKLQTLQAAEIANLKIRLLYWCFETAQGLKLRNRSVLVDHYGGDALQMSPETLAVVASYHYEELWGVVCCTLHIAFVVDIHMKSDRSANNQNRAAENE